MAGLLMAVVIRKIPDSKKLGCFKGEALLLKKFS